MKIKTDLGLLEPIPQTYTIFDPTDPNFAYLVDKFGAPFQYRDFNKISSVNERFWAGAYDFENIVVFESTEKSFYQYVENTGLYSEISEDYLKDKIAERMLSEGRNGNIENLAVKITARMLTSVVSHLRGICEKHDAFNKTDSYIHLKNGILRINRGQVSTLELFSYKLYSRNMCPIAYNPEAKCDQFLNELLMSAVSKEDALTIQKYCGMCLLGNNLIQRILILDGAAGRGKSTLVSVIRKLVGSENITELRTQHLNTRFEDQRYLKKTVLAGVDVPGGFLSEKGAYRIKALVGGDALDAEQKGVSRSISILGDFCVLITANTRLKVRLDSDVGAWRRRLLICRFEGRPPQRKIPKFADYLIEREGSGILNWALTGLEMLFKDIERYGDIELPESQETVIDALLAESDSVRHFLSSKVERMDAGDLTVDELVEAYSEYCPSMGWNPKSLPVIRHELENLMLELFGTSKSHSVRRDGKSLRGFRRVVFKDSV